MTIKEMQFQDEPNEDELREKKEFEKWYNERMKDGNKTGYKLFKMDGFKRTVIDSFDNTVIFDEVPNILSKNKEDKKDKWKNAGGTTLSTANHMWEAWMAKANK